MSSEVVTHGRGIVRRWRRGVAVVLLLALVVFAAAPGAQGQFWVLVNGALNYTGPVTVNGVTTNNVNAIAATSTDGITLANNTDATAGIPVQQSPRLRFRSNVWNTTAVAATNTQDWVIESIPISQAVPNGNLYFRTSLNGAALVNPMYIDTLGNFVAATSINAGTNVNVAAGSYLTWTSRNRIYAPADGQINLTDFATTHGFGFDVATDGVAKIRTRAQTGYATVDALQLNLNGVPVLTSTAPTISGFAGSGPAASVTAGSTTAAFRIGVGGTAPGTTGTINLPTATTGWNCWVVDQTTPLDITRQTSSTTSSVTITSTIAWTAADILIGGCTAF